MLHELSNNPSAYLLRTQQPTDIYIHNSIHMPRTIKYTIGPKQANSYRIPVHYETHKLGYIVSVIDSTTTQASFFVNTNHTEFMALPAMLFQYVWHNWLYHEQLPYNIRIYYMGNCLICGTHLATSAYFKGVCPKCSL